jgi:hypothetical protein
MMEQRQHPRRDVRLSAEVVSEQTTFTATTRNLSVGGCCLDADYVFHEDATLHLSLFLVVDGVEDARMPPLVARGTVQWTAETDDCRHSAGIRFIGLSDAQTQWLEQFLAKTDHD